MNYDTTALANQISGRINRDADRLNQCWRTPEGTHTRHLIIDDLLAADAVSRIARAFPIDSAKWVQRDSFRERKKTFAKLDSVDPVIGSITDAFHTDEVLQAVKAVTGIEALEPDPNLYAGGISMMGKGDFLNPHIDNSHDAKRERYRRLNLLYYVSPDWQIGYGGNFELWDERVAKPKEIHSKYNRLVVMETNRFSWHSVNPVLTDKARCCVSNYYFTKNSPELRDYYHVTSFLGRPDQTAIRIWGRADNLARQCVSVLTGTSRGKSLVRYK
jgi:hypothetical protein